MFLLDFADSDATVIGADQHKATYPNVLFQHSASKVVAGCDMAPQAGLSETRLECRSPLPSRCCQAIGVQGRYAIYWRFSQLGYRKINEALRAVREALGLEIRSEPVTVRSV